MIFSNFTKKGVVYELISFIFVDNFAPRREKVALIFRLTGYGNVPSCDSHVDDFL